MLNSSVRNYLPGKPYLFSDEDNNSSPEAILHRDRYRSNLYGLPSHSYNEGAVQGNNGIRFFIQDETIDPKFNHLNQATHEVEQTEEQDMEIGYEESPPPPTYEGLEQRFIDEITKLVRQRSDAEDAEFTRHKERILEINNDYQEKLSALRVLQATRREEFLRNELQERLNKYHESIRNQRSQSRVPESHGYTSSSKFIAGEANSRFHGFTEYKYDIDRIASLSSGRSEGSESRVPLPPGRVYNKSAAYP